MYSSLSVTSTGEVKHGSATLVAENGPHVVFVLSVPLILTFAVGVALKLHENRRAMAVAWTLAGLLALFNLAAMMTVGLFIVPVTVCLLYACSHYSPESKP
jgi:NhaP-type Na+/H+ or K+/H+ antiporter